MVASDGKALFPLSNDGIDMLKGCQEWLKINLDEEEYKARVTYIFNFAYNFKKSEKPFKSNERFKECERELENLAQYLQRKNCEDAMYYAAYILVHTRNFTRRMVFKRRDFENVKSVYEEFKRIKDNSKDPFTSAFNSRYKNWLESCETSRDCIAISLCASLLIVSIMLAILWFVPIKLSTPENVGGISVEVGNKAFFGNIKWHIDLQVDKIENGELEYENASSLISDISDRFELYDISLVSKYYDTQPGGAVKVTMNIPDGFSSENIAVYRIARNRKYEMEATVKDFDTVVFETDNFGFYAIVEIPYSVVFKDDFGHNIPNQKIYGGNKVAEPSEIGRNGHDFIGWYYGDRMWNFAKDTVSEDMILTAKWSAHTYTIVYDGNKPASASGSIENLPDNFICHYDGDLALGAVPTLEGWKFGGWYKDKACTEKVGEAGETLASPNLATEGTVSPKAAAES